MQKDWRLAAVEAADAAFRSRRRDEDLRRSTLHAWRPAMNALSIRAISLERRPTALGVDNEARGRFHDRRSREQIATYLAHRLLPSDERNRSGLARWNDSVRQQWELEHLGSSRRIT